MKPILHPTYIGGQVKTLAFIILLLVSTVAGYLLGNQNSDKSPVWECYRYIWGDSTAMQRLGIEDYSAKDVHGYCVDMINNERGEPAVTLEQLEQRPSEIKIIEIPCLPDDFPEHDYEGCRENGHPEGDD